MNWTQEDVWAMVQDPRALIVPALFVLGLILKGIKGFPNWGIPATLGLAGLILGVMVIGDVAGALAGVVLSLIPIGAHQAVKQTIEQK